MVKKLFEYLYTLFGHHGHEIISFLSIGYSVSGLLTSVEIFIYYSHKAAKSHNVNLPSEIVLYLGQWLSEMGQIHKI